MKNQETHKSALDGAGESLARCGELIADIHKEMDRQDRISARIVLWLIAAFVVIVVSGVTHDLLFK